LVSKKQHIKETSKLGGELIRVRQEHNKRISELKAEIEHLKAEVSETTEKLNERTAELEKAGNFKRQKTTDTGKIKRLEAKLKEKDEYIEELHAQVDELITERHQHFIRAKSKAGRKSKATDENLAEITRLRDEGYSYSQIAEIITENSGEYICKSTVANIVHKYSCTDKN